MQRPLIRMCQTTYKKNANLQEHCIRNSDLLRRSELVHYYNIKCKLSLYENINRLVIDYS